MSDRIFKLGELVVYKHYFECCDDQTGEIETYQEFRGIGIIIDINEQNSGWLKIWWQKHPWEKLLNNIGSDDFVVQIVDQQNQPIGEIWEVWAGEGTLNISVKKH
jgi:hypothetical protein